MLLQSHLSATRMPVYSVSDLIIRGTENAKSERNLLVSNVIIISGKNAPPEIRKAGRKAFHCFLASFSKLDNCSVLFQRFGR